jgi:cell division protein FtsZ
MIARRPLPPQAPAPQPEAPRSAGTLFERMANLSARRRDDNDAGGDEGGSINIPRFLGRQNNQ